MRIPAIGLPCAVEPVWAASLLGFGKRVHADRGKGCSLSYLVRERHLDCVLKRIALHGLMLSPIRGARAAWRLAAHHSFFILIILIQVLAVPPANKE
jgi:hypothetical protein